MLLILLASGLALGACAAKPHWSKPGASDRETEKAWTDCQDFAERRVGYQRTDDSSPLRAEDHRRTVNRYDQALEGCMRGQGYFPTKR
jgi:hypothetical protein